jgi:choline-phosphate cytidylyltransferase
MRSSNTHHGLSLRVPFTIKIEFLDKHKIDFVCHDDIPYVTAGIDDAYALCKKLGRFKAT